MSVLRRKPSAMPSALPSPKRSMVGSGHPKLAQLLLVLLALGLGGWGAWRSFAPQPSNAREQLVAQATQIANLQQQVANLRRSDQISRQANTDLQGTLAERDEEVAG
ncbi:MAG TPA: hypothetical protein PK789_08195, partial [Thermomonas sp.]